EDQVILQCRSTIVDSVSYSRSLGFPVPNGASLSLDFDILDAIENDNGLNWCEATSEFGKGDLGTPGRVNDTCQIADCFLDSMNLVLTNRDCLGEDFMFELSFDTLARGDFEVIRLADGTVLGSGFTSPITVTFENNLDNETFEVFLRDARNPDCDSDTIRVKPFDCIPSFGDLVITEIHNSPDTFTVDGEWFEVYNAVPDTINMKGYTIRDAEGSRQDNFTIDTDFIVLPNQYVVFARSGDIFTNGGVIADYVYGSEMSLSNSADEIIIELGDLLIDSVGYDGGVIFPSKRGESISLDGRILDAAENDDGSNWCLGRQSYGLGGLGSPGQANPFCAPCLITGLDTENGQCTEEGYTFEVKFRAERSTRNFEIVRVDDGSVLATGTESPILVTLPENRDTTSFEIFIRDAEKPNCSSVTLLISPLDCVPFNCASEGDLVITEIQKNPTSVADTLGEWFELYNSTSEPINLNGYIIRDNGNDFHEIDTDLIIPAMSYLVFGANDTMMVNGGVAVDYVYDNFVLGNGRDEIIIECRDTIIDIVAYDGGDIFPNPSGASMNLNPNFLNASDNDNGNYWCISSTTYGDGDLGTPGAANDGCPDCMISNVSVQNDVCQDVNFVFEVAFEFAAGNGDYEIVRTDNGKILATGSTSPIQVTLASNRDNSDFEVIVRNVFDETCQSEAVLVDAKNCIDPCDIVISTTSFTLPFCKGNNDGTITINATATLPLEYSIDGGATFQNDPTFTNLESGDYEVVVQTIGLDDCEERFTYTLMEGSPLELSRIIKEDETCADANDGRIEIYARLFVRDLLYSID
ncbi:MAG: lamin tail domain-containing protein, partial [Bacteroidota bacterium]